MMLKHLISFGLVATVLFAPAANAATLTAQVPTTKVALPAPMTDAELDEVEGEGVTLITLGYAIAKDGVDDARDAASRGDYGRVGKAILQTTVGVAVTVYGAHPVTIFSTP